MNHAVELFTSHIPHYNCSQAVAAAFGRDDLLEELKSCGGGRAPEGRCGALHAARLMVPEDRADALEQEFVKELGASTCRSLKAEYHVPCPRCVGLAAELAGKYR